MEDGRAKGETLRPPWHYLAVTLISLILPPGGAILTIWNLERLKQIDSTSARRLAVAGIIVFASGYTALIALALPSSGSTTKLDVNTPYILNIGVALASYAVQRNPFREWRATHLTEKTSSWLSALGVALIYALIFLLVAVPLAFLATHFVHHGSGTVS